MEQRQKKKEKKDEVEKNKLLKYFDMEKEWGKKKPIGKKTILSNTPPKAIYRWLLIAKIWIPTFYKLCTTKI